MSSLQRSRSLRKPAIVSSDLAAKDANPALRNASPSRLPVKPHAPNASTTAASITTGLRNTRPVTSTLGRAPSTRQAGATQDPNKRETSRYPPSTTTTRPAPTARPTSSGGLASQTRRAPTHARAKSTTSSVNTSTILRPPSQGQTRVGTATGPRAAHGRTASVDKPPTTPSAPGPTHAQTRLRPTFSTLQQHYSPAKTLASKPLTSTFLAPPSPSKLPANVAASAEIGRLQAELLQLHLLHRDAAVVDAQWRASARDKLSERYARLCDASKAVDEQERAGAERDNVLALRGWGAGGGLEERIQALDSVVNGLWTLSEPGGRYARVVRRFERWVDRVCEVEDARRDSGVMLRGQAALFVAELDASWKDECLGLLRRLDGWRRQLREIGQVPDEDETGRSSLARMVESSKSLIHGMLEELHTMEGVELEIKAREDEWIEAMIRDDDDDNTPRAGAIWRVV